MKQLRGRDSETRLVHVGTLAVVVAVPRAVGAVDEAPAVVVAAAAAAVVVE